MTAAAATGNFLLPNFQSFYNEALSLHEDCEVRRLLDVSLWSGELLVFACKRVDELGEPAALHITLDSIKLCGLSPANYSFAELAKLRFAQSCMDNKEFLRGSHVLSTMASEPLTTFLLFYCKYLACEKAYIDSVGDLLGPEAEQASKDFSTSLVPLLAGFEDLVKENKMDSWLHYLYALVLKRMGSGEEAISSLLTSLAQYPTFWGAWKELLALIRTKEDLEDLALPDHWLKYIFLGEAYIKLHMAKEAICVLSELIETPNSVLSSWPFLLERLAAAHHEETPQADDRIIEIFSQLQETDPYRLGGLDVYSNSLYVQGCSVELANLADHVFDVDRFCVESCCVVANYFAQPQKGEHEKAIKYFHRALKLNPNNAGTWVLIGHEFMETDNSSAATLAYKTAIEIDPLDHRGWYALGQRYEIAKMPTWALYYYRQAHLLCPSDSRFLTALGAVYEKLSKNTEAAKAYWKAHSVGDIENGRALLSLGQLCEKTGDGERAAGVYSLYLERLTENIQTNDQEQARCYKFLAEYWMKNNKPDEANYYAERCLAYDQTREEMKELQKQINKLKVEADEEVLEEEGSQDESMVIEDD